MLLVIINTVQAYNDILAGRREVLQTAVQSVSNEVLDLQQQAAAGAYGAPQGYQAPPQQPGYAPAQPQQPAHVAPQQAAPAPVAGVRPTWAK